MGKQDRKIFKILILNLFSILLFSCSISPTYSGKEIEEAIKKICKEEYNLDVSVFRKKDTIWIYAPLELFDEKKWAFKYDEKKQRWEEDIQEKIRKLSTSIERVLLSGDKLPSFYCLILSNINRIGADWYTIVYIPDQIRHMWESQYIYVPSEIYGERRPWFFYNNGLALKDTLGKHIIDLIYDLSFDEFFSLVLFYNINYQLYKEEYKDTFSLNNLNIKLSGNTLTIYYDIEIKRIESNKPFPKELIKKTVEKFISYYKENLGFSQIELYNENTDEVEIINIKHKENKDINANSNNWHLLSLFRIQTLNYIIDRLSFFYDPEREEKEEQKDIERSFRKLEKELNAMLNTDNRYVKFEVLKTLGYLYLGQDKYLEALKYFEEANTIYNNQDYHLLYLIGIYYATLSQNSNDNSYSNKALEYHLASYHLNPDNPDNLIALENIYYSTGNIREAQKYLEKVLSSTQDKRYWARAYFVIENYEKSSEYSNEYLSEHPESPYIYDLMGINYANRFDKKSQILTCESLKEAKSDFDKAIEYIETAQKYNSLDNKDRVSKRYLRKDMELIKILKSKKEEYKKLLETCY